MKFGTFIKRGLFLGAVFVILAGLAWYFSEYTVSQSEIKHIVLVSIDTCRADHLGCYGYRRNTSPNIDAVAVDGVQFNHAVTPVPVTLPSHSSMLTGTIPPYHKVRDNSSYRLAGTNVTLAEILSDSGFVTGAVVGAYVLDSQFGLDQGFETYDDNIQTDEDKKLFSINERGAAKVTSCANAWLEKHQDEKFFLFLHYFDPHVPYQLHQRFPFTSQPGRSYPTDRYDGEIAYVDYCIGQVIKKLKELNLYESTLLIITSDHGESLGEHGENSHSFFIYHSTLHVPLIVKLPGGPKRKTIDNIVGLIDIAPTVCGSMGIPVPDHMQGVNLASLIYSGNDTLAERHLFCESLVPTKFELGPFLGIVSDRWKYINTSKPELYDLKEDPRETKNLLAQHPRQARIMKDRLGLVLHNSNLSSAANNKVEFNGEAISRLQSLGYISSRTVDENIQTGRDSPDPKEFIEVYNFMESFLRLASNKRYEEAKKLTADMLTKRPDMKQAYYYLGVVAVAQKDEEAVKTYFTRYLELSGRDSNGFDRRAKSTYELADAHAHLGDMFKREGQTKQAVAHYRKSLSYNPYKTKSNYNLTAIYVLQGDINEAVTCYRRIAELDPDAAEALNNLAWILATTEHSKVYNPSNALNFALRACELTGYNNAAYLDSLAAAYAAVGRFKDAVKTAEKAIGLAKSANQPQLAEEITKHREFYKRSQPYFDPALAVHIEESSPHLK